MLALPGAENCLQMADVPALEFTCFRIPVIAFQNSAAAFPDYIIHVIAQHIRKGAVCHHNGVVPVYETEPG